MIDATPKKLLMFHARHQDPMVLYRSLDGQLRWSDTDEEPEFIRDGAERIEGFSVFEGEEGTLEQADIDGDTEIGYEDGFAVGDGWATGKIRPATIADVLEIFPELAAPLNTTTSEEE